MLFTVMALLIIILSQPGNWCLAEAPTTPVQIVQRLNHNLLRVMKNSEEFGFQGRYKLLEPVVKKSFALDFMLKKSVGRYWSKMSPKEQKELLGLFSRWSVSLYASRFDSYNGQRFQVKSKNASQRWLTVDSTMHKKNGDKVMFRYVLIKSNDRWEILDIKVNGISQLAMTKSQMASILKCKGLEGLRQSLEDKIKALSGNRDTGSVSSADEIFSIPSSSPGKKTQSSRGKGE